MVPSCQSGFNLLAAEPPKADRGRFVSAARPTSSPKNRVGGFRRHASGRLSRRRRFQPMFTPGSRACAYKTASGRGNWPNRDPYDEDGFMVFMDENDIPLMEQTINPYLFAVNDPLIHLDWLGLKSSGGSGASSSDRASCCAKAKQQGLDHGNVGGGVCCDGKMYACVWIRGGATGANSKKAKQIIDYCSYLHELHHLPDSAPCPACGTSRTVFKNGVDPDQGECDAYKVEVSCLNRGLKECKGDKQCIQQVTAEINSDENLMKNTYHCK